MINVLAAAAGTSVQRAFVEMLAFVADGDFDIHTPVITARQSRRIDQLVETFRRQFFF
jgi:hypothetical protein